MQPSKIIFAIGCVAASFTLQGCGDSIKAAMQAQITQMIPSVCDTTIDVVFGQFTELANTKIGEMCADVPAATKAACETKGSTTVSTNLVAETAAQKAKCIAQLTNITNVESFNLAAISAQVEQFVAMMKPGEEASINSILSNFGKEELGAKFDASKASITSRLYVAVPNQYNKSNRNTAEFPWLSLGASMMMVGAAGFGLKRFLTGRANSDDEEHDEEDVQEVLLE